MNDSTYLSPQAYILYISTSFVIVSLFQQTKKLNPFRKPNVIVIKTKTDKKLDAYTELDVNLTHFLKIKPKTEI